MVTLGMSREVKDDDGNVQQVASSTLGVTADLAAAVAVCESLKGAVDSADLDRKLKVAGEGCAKLYEGLAKRDIAAFASTKVLWNQWPNFEVAAGMPACDEAALDAAVGKQAQLILPDDCAFQLRGKKVHVLVKQVRYGDDGKQVLLRQSGGGSDGDVAVDAAWLLAALKASAPAKYLYSTTLQSYGGTRVYRVPSS